MNKQNRKLIKLKPRKQFLPPELRAPMPSPTIAHKNKKKYNRKNAKALNRKLYVNN